MAFLDSIDISVRPITVGAKHKATKTFFNILFALESVQLGKLISLLIIYLIAKHYRSNN